MSGDSGPGQSQTGPLSATTLRAVFDSAPEAMFLYESETGSIRGANDRFRALFDWGRGTIDQLTTADISSDSESEAALYEYASRVGQGESQTIEWEASTGGGGTSRVELDLRPLADTDESLVLATVDTDGTDRDRERPTWMTETADVALDSAGVGAWQYDPASETVRWSDVAHRLHDRPVDGADLTLETMVGLYAPADRAALRDGIERATHEGEAYDGVHRLAADDRWIRVRAVPETPAGGAHVVRGSLVDVTDMELRETQFTVLSDAGEELVQASSRTRITEVLIDAAKQILGYDGAAVRLLGDDERTLEVAATTEENVAAAGERPSYSVDEDVPAARAFRANEPEVFTDPDVTDDEYDRTGLRSGLYVPIDGHGVFSCADPAPCAYDETDVELMAVLTKLASTVYSRLESELELRAQRREREQVNTRLELTLDEADTGVWEWDLDTDDVRWDETSDRLFGYDPGEFPGEFSGFADRVPAEDLQRVEQRVDRAIETGEQYRAEFRVRPPGNDRRWIQARGIVEYDDTGDPERLLGIQTDITDRKESEEALQGAREQLRQVIDLIPDPIYAKTRDDEVLLSNEANAELHGMTPEELEGTREEEIEADVENIEDFDKYRHREIEVMETGTPMTFEEQLADPDGETQVFETTRIPFEATRRDEAAVLGYARDVTDRKEYERELEQTNRKLEQFAGVVSHDLRNPLNVARGYAEGLGPYVDEEGQQFVEEINRSHERMEAMIEELLVLSRAGDTVDDPEQVALADVASESWDTTTTDGVEIELEVPETVTVGADRSRLRHLCENLVRNAVDHNDPPLTIRVGTLEDSDGTDGPTTVGFFVSDDGDGIPENERDDVFEHGYTTDDEGTGFGLSIVADVVDAHGWDVDITESNDGGARFEITGVDPGT